MVANEFDVRSMDVLQLASSSGCSAYDCEFVALAKTLNIPLVTADKKNISEFPDTAVTMEMVLAQRHMIVVQTLWPLVPSMVKTKPSSQIITGLPSVLRRYVRDE